MSSSDNLAPPIPATEPIWTKGNAFWRGDERFLIKGINYFKRKSTDDKIPPGPSDPIIDALADECLDELERDILILRELGLNGISVTCLDPTKNHQRAFKLLADHGFYVLVKIGSEYRGRVPADANMQDHYHSEVLTDTLRLVDELADCPNILGFCVSGQRLNSVAGTRAAELLRAVIRDVKKFLHLRDGTRVPLVGISTPDIMMQRLLSLQYFSAGAQSDRADFFAPQCYSWAYQSSFIISGWKNMVQSHGQFPIPMFLAEYGARVDRPRIWQEIECLYSADMTGVFSGGFAYCFEEYGNQYGIVEDDGRGGIRKKEEFSRLKKRFRAVEDRASDQNSTVDAEKEYESYLGVFPDIQNNRWLATDSLPECPMDLMAVVQNLEDEREWVVVESNHETREDSDVHHLARHVADVDLR